MRCIFERYTAKFLYSQIYDSQYFDTHRNSGKNTFQQHLSPHNARRNVRAFRFSVSAGICLFSSSLASVLVASEFGGGRRDNFFPETEYSAVLYQNRYGHPRSLSDPDCGATLGTLQRLSFSGLTDINQNWKTKVDKLQRSCSHTRWRQALKRMQRQKTKYSGVALSLGRIRAQTKWTWILNVKQSNLSTSSSGKI